MNHRFTLVLDRPPSKTDEDALFDAGCDDATLEVRNQTGLAHFDREGVSLITAIVSAVLEVRSTGIGVRSVGTDPELVSLREIADRTGRTYESVRLLSTGARGPGGFPASLTSNGPAVYRWDRVATWFGAEAGTAERGTLAMLELADAFVRATDPEALVRLEDIKELERLLAA
ncbi:MAG: hypothetical protein U0990_02220 [Candidatus Nanopelagicales bacterium]|nr:hypothetical protein [Candidatus Nanopelagicales bacterium]MDZ4248886.1 hypothetical protein [Candidatus Nanopelagicales bacterium]MDZ7578862.1 hypothetical protein [Candidatus Nanopelagicales bacterium]